MEDSIKKMGDERIILLCLFKDGFLSDILKVKNYDILYFSKICEHIISFCKLNYYPEEYKIKLFNQLEELRKVNDERKLLRNEMINLLQDGVKMFTTTKEYYKEYMLASLEMTEYEIEHSTDLSGDYKKSALLIIYTCKENLEKIRKVNDPDNSKKRIEVSHAITKLHDLCDTFSELYIVRNMVSRFTNILCSLIEPNGFDEYEEYIYEKFNERIKINEENVHYEIERLVVATSNEVTILKTHLDEKHFNKHFNDLIAFSAIDEYYKALRILVTENPDLLQNEVFVENARKLVCLKNNEHIKKLLGRRTYRQFK